MRWCLQPRQASSLHPRLVLLALALGLAYAPSLHAADSSGGQPSTSMASPPANGEAGPIAPSPTSLQWHTALAPGVCAVRGPERSIRFCAALSGHVLFGRARDSDVGFGPYVRGLGVLDEGISLAGGGSLLLPLSPTYPVIVTLGGLARFARGSHEPGMEAMLFVGPSSYNFHSSYSMASGILLGFQQTWGAQATSTVALALQLDMAWLALPLIALIEVLRGPPEP